MKPNFCLPIISPTFSDVQQRIDANIHTYRYFEVWIDYITDFSLTQCHKLSDQLGKRLILLFRRQRLEPILMDVEKRFLYIQEIAKTPVYLDLDISTQQDEVSYIRKMQLTPQLITSYHNYTETPSQEFLDDVIAQMGAFNPSLYKISTFCQTETDSVRLLSTLIRLRNESKRCIVLGMGEKGIITRIFGSLWGNEMTFAPRENSASSAPGQLTKRELETILTIIS